MPRLWIPISIIMRCLYNKITTTYLFIYLFRHITLLRVFLVRLNQSGGRIKVRLQETYFVSREERIERVGGGPCPAMGHTGLIIFLSIRHFS